jgi:hypothetical protein
MIGFFGLRMSCHVGTSLPWPETNETSSNGVVESLFWSFSHFLQPSPSTFSEVFTCMFEYIDRIFAIVRPRKLLFMAIGL